MKKSYLAYIVLFVLLLGTTMSFGATDASFEIRAFAYADIDSPANEDYDTAIGVVTAPQSGTYDYEYQIYVSVYADIRGGSAVASYAYANASVYGEVNDSIGVYDADPLFGSTSDSASDSGTIYMDGSDTIYIYGDVGAEADWFGGGQCRGSAYATGSVSIE